MKDYYLEYKVEPSKNAYIKYLIKMIENVDQHGKVITIVPQGFLFKKSKTEYYLRKKLIEKNRISAIIALPEKLFYHTKVPVVILIIDKSKKTKDILFIDASKEYKRKRKINILTNENQDKIVDTYQKFETIDNYSYVANFEEIEQNDYELSVKKYVKSQEMMEEIDQEKLEQKIKKLEEEKHKVQKELNKLLNEI